MTPGTNFPVLYCNPNTGARELQIMTWGLVPSFTSQNEQQPDFFKMFNARLESVDEKPSFRKIAKTKRCVMLLSGYYEWKVSSETGRKQPYYVGRTGDNGGQVLCLAALYDSWKHQVEVKVAGFDHGHYSEGVKVEEEEMKTFTIITADAAKSSMEGIQTLHDRQPVFLCTSVAIDQWLQGAANGDGADKVTTAPTASLLDSSCVPADLDIHAVTPLMSHASYQLEDCASRIASPLKSKRMTDFFTKNQPVILTFLCLCYSSLTMSILLSPWSPNKQPPISQDIQAANSPKKQPSSANMGTSPSPSHTSPARTSHSSLRRTSSSSSSHKSPADNKKRPGGNILQFFNTAHGDSPTSKKATVAADSGDSGKAAKKRKSRANCDVHNSASADDSHSLSEEEQVRRAIAESLKDVATVIDTS
eukprot:CAMPEP_0114469836 /NCGR_PEP_ID=MMETSP0104-20121206/10932_1 /TAXON_ID=37642 ORGANISM="Paraphysomonas imperforata, Strain PA2" /NCGR_SAMPLE_ID=MMETSP0104 /ASSEMBLY_ACC=CAM_ASM_000202 /LENGTH=418 /DNA_ID=CAMNT_0001643523 /DNA_START=113 /DNA_END=1371 /DNA_ORIENTATION=-